MYFSSALRPGDFEYCKLMYSKDSNDGGVTYNGIHPDENGHELFYKMILKFLESL